MSLFLCYFGIFLAKTFRHLHCWCIHLSLGHFGSWWHSHLHVCWSKTWLNLHTSFCMHWHSQDRSIHFPLHAFLNSALHFDSSKHFFNFAHSMNDKIDKIVIKIINLFILIINVWSVTLKIKELKMLDTCNYFGVLYWASSDNYLLY